MNVWKSSEFEKQMKQEYRANTRKFLTWMVVLIMVLVAYSGAYAAPVLTDFQGNPVMDGEGNCVRCETGKDVAGCDMASALNAYNTLLVDDTASSIIQPGASGVTLEYQTASGAVGVAESSVVPNYTFESTQVSNRHITVVLPPPNKDAEHTVTAMNGDFVSMSGIAQSCSEPVAASSVPSTPEQRNAASPWLVAFFIGFFFVGFGLGYAAAWSERK